MFCDACWILTVLILVLIRLWGKETKVERPHGVPHGTSHGILFLWDKIIRGFLETQVFTKYQIIVHCMFRPNSYYKNGPRGRGHIS